MSRTISVDAIVNTILQERGPDPLHGLEIGPGTRFARQTWGLSEYERDEVARLVGFRLAASAGRSQ